MPGAKFRASGFGLRELRAVSAQGSLDKFSEPKSVGQVLLQRSFRVVSKRCTRLL